MEYFSLLNFIAWNFDGSFPHIKSEKHENEICNWSMQSPFDQLIFVLKGIGISSFHNNLQHQIKSHLAMKKFAGTKSENITLKRLVLKECQYWTQNVESFF
jgi:hypothetical protein